MVNAVCHMVTITLLTTDFNAKAIAMHRHIAMYLATYERFISISITWEHESLVLKLMSMQVRN